MIFRYNWEQHRRTPTGPAAKHPDRRNADRPAVFLLQAGIAAVLLVAARFFPAELNRNYAYRDPVFDRAWGPAPVHLTIIFVGIVALLYWPTHVLLARLFSGPGLTR